jgi:hypothetical protein
MAWGGWLHFGPMALSGVRQSSGMPRCGLVVFLMVGCVEEGIFRCYLAVYAHPRHQLLVGAWDGRLALLFLLFKSPRATAFGASMPIALLGLLPCLWLHLKKAEGAGFWQATWVTSTIFGFIHTTNNGENWIGIFAAAFVGVFSASAYG